MSVICKVGEDCGCSFKNTGASYPHVWNDIHRLINQKIDCEECKRHGHESVDGLRDHIKVGIGKKPFNIKNYQRFVNEVNCVWDKCKSDGRCVA